MKICEACNCNDKNTIKQNNTGSKYKKLCDETKEWPQWLSPGLLSLHEVDFRAEKYLVADDAF